MSNFLSKLQSTDQSNN